MKKIKRKQFLKTIASGAIGLGGLGLLNYRNYQSAFADNLRKKRIVVGSQTWIYAARLPGYDITPVLDQIFSDLSYAGMDGVELMHHPLRSSDTTLHIAELKETYNLPVIGASYNADMWDRDQHHTILKDVETVITNLAKVGGRTLGANVGNSSSIKTTKQLDAQADLLKKMMSICEKNEVVLNLHNHTHELENNMHELKGTLSRIPELKLGPDLNWVMRAGVDPVNFLSQFGDKIVFLHLRDQYKNGRWTEYLGQGNTDFVAIAKELKQINFTGDVIIELAHEQDFEPIKPIRESLKISREFVRESMEI
ncbi:hypothetical protein BH23BAC3_BH23BAC3_22740 [soil metagenome]